MYINNIYLVKTLDFSIIFSLIKIWEIEYITIYLFDIHVLSLISFAIFIGAVGKSAQMGLHNVVTLMQ